MAAGGPRCCGCNKRGRCVSCSCVVSPARPLPPCGKGLAGETSSCVKVGKQCSNCLPLTEDHCDNSMSANSSIVTPAATRSSLNSNLSSSSPIDLTVDTSIHPLSTTNPLNTDHSVIVSHPTSSLTTNNLDSPQEPIIVSSSSTNPPQSTSSLPDFPLLPDPSFVWGKNDGNVTSTQLTTCYKEVVHWKRNLFRVPIGKTGDAFVNELANLFNAYATSSSLESIALYAAMTMPHLLLQRPTGKLKHKEITKHLERRLSLWKNGDFLSLLSEGRSIQSRLKSHRSASNSTDNLARKFSNLVFVGDVKGAIRLLSDNENGRVLSLDSLMNGRSVKEILLDKHPPNRCKKVAIL